jgi:type IV pilus assembly protein PilW
MSRRLQKGMTIVELMVAMVLGLVIIGGVISVLLANKRSFSSNEGLSQIQETARTAFELMARDIRQAGGTGCDNAQRMTSALNAGAQWWLTWNSVRGYDGGADDPALTEGSAETNRIAATDSLSLMGFDGAQLPIASHNAAGSVLRVSANTTPFGVGDIMLVCDFDHSAIFQISDYDDSDATITAISHDTGGTTPGNCTATLGFPTNCAVPNEYPFPQNSQIGRLYAVDWFVGDNGRPQEGGRSLYRARLGPTGAMVIEEMAAGVVDMQIIYGRNGVDTIDTATTLGTGANWANVNSVFITLTVRSSDMNVTTEPGVNQGRLERTFNYLVTLRNRVQ